MKSIRTTVMGVLVVMSAVIAAVIPLLDMDPSTMPNWGEMGAGIMAGIGLVFAKDERGGLVNLKSYMTKVLILCGGVGIVLCAIAGCVTIQDTTGARHTTIDWKAVDEAVKNLQPYVRQAIRDGCTIAAEYRKIKDEQEAISAQEKRERTAFYGGCVAGMYTYQVNHDVDESIQAADRTISLLGGTKSFTALARDWIANPKGTKHPSDVDALLEIVQNRLDTSPLSGSSKP